METPTQKTTLVPEDVYVTNQSSVKILWLKKIRILSINLIKKTFPSLRWILILAIGFGLGGFLSSLFNSWTVGGDTDSLSTSYSDSGDEVSIEDCSVLGINLHGFITTYLPIGGDTGFNYGADQVASEDVAAIIEKANEEENIKAIIVEVDSTGGSPVAGEEIANKIKKSKKPVIAFIRDSGLSTAYWAISSADRIFASKNSDVGSIGVTLSYISNVEKNRKDGYQFEELSSGKYKNSGSPDKSLTEDERFIFMRDIKIMYENFMNDVSDNRKIPIEKVKIFSDGSTVLGEQAKSLGLIDEIGGYDEVEKYIEGVIGEKPEVCWQ